MIIRTRFSWVEASLATDTDDWNLLSACQKTVCEMLIYFDSLQLTRWILYLSKSFRSLVESMLINWWPKFRNKSNGEGIFTFYSENAQEILKDIKYAKSPKKKSLSNDAGSNAKEASSGGSIILKNPLTYLFKRESSQTSKDKTENIAKQEKGRRKVLEKSVSMMEEFNRQEKISRQQKKELLRELKSGQATAKSSSLTRTRTQPSHLDTSYYRCGHVNSAIVCLFHNTNSAIQKK